jgi:hypothetical protein
VKETVQVTADAPLLEAASSAIGEVVNHLTSTALPLNGRDVMQLVALTPGINSAPPDHSAQPFASGNIASNKFSANGGRDGSNMVLLDGSPQEVMGYNQPGYVPPPDAVEEFKVVSNTMSAEYGRTGGAVISMVHRAGTKDFHGDAYEFLRNVVRHRAPFRGELPVRAAVRERESVSERRAGAAGDCGGMVGERNRHRTERISDFDHVADGHDRIERRRAAAGCNRDFDA